MALLLALAACSSDYSYRSAVADRVDIHDVVECAFDEVDGGYEQYSCVPIFSNVDESAGDWERDGIGDFDILQRDVFGAPFYELFYSGSSGSSSDIGYALSMDGVSWRRHPYNPVLRRGRSSGAFDYDDVSVGCMAFDGSLGLYHLWYTGTNNSSRGTLFGHATSPDGVIWDKDLFNPIDPFEDGVSELSRVWGCDALYEDGGFHFWVGGVNWEGDGFVNPEEWLASAKYDIGYLYTEDGSDFTVQRELVLEHTGLEGSSFDAEGVHKPSVFTYTGEQDTPRYWMLYSGYNRVTASEDPFSQMIFIESEGKRLGMASSSSPSSGWTRLSQAPLPFDFSGAENAENPRAFFINGRLHVFFNDRFADEFGEPISGIGLGIAPFPSEEALQ
ncbi:MAG: hypothetical protein CMP23_04085 [Rickettsiales bacterium]|nr:hypothetical protein [Rickettsiales bacterium]